MGECLDVEVGAHTASDRVKVWTALLEEHCMGIECRNAGEDMRASLKLRGIGDRSVARASFTKQTMLRTLAHIRNCTEEQVLLAFVMDGRHVIKQGRTNAVLDGSGMYFLDATRPLEVDFASDQITQTAIHVPKSAITSRLGPIEELVFEPEAPLQKLLSTFAINISRSVETLDAITLDTLLNQTLDLFALMVAQRKGRAAEPSTHRAGTLVRIKAYIQAHLRDEELTLERTAHALGISTRYVNALLAAEGTSFGRYLLAGRLEGARREIMDPSRINKQVTEIAYGWGFKSPSHFGRAFKERYGMAPRDAKHSER